MDTIQTAKLVNADAEFGDLVGREGRLERLYSGCFSFLHGELIIIPTEIRRNPGDLMVVSVWGNRFLFRILAEQEAVRISA